ncbi:polysaccharide pyruvyl transferase family protein [Cereibacter sediminicola]|uniref:polysaccharide pyruvyl transferase family protein n=1 Tax=Cereibacter sediminicola TaxID=2584941 RepID=UPI0011AA468D|nr:polysaccharide pyruvyl transferase family protein [Cereibacter sediminicola]
MKKTAVVVGPYRVHNFGDDLVGAIIAKRLQQVGYDVVIPKLGQSNANWIGTEFAESYDGIFDKADTIVVGGGGIMSDTSGAKPGASYLDIVARAAIAGKTQGKRMFVTSVGAGPWKLPRSKMLAFGISMMADKIGVRDQESFDHLASIGIRGPKVVLGADCALLSKDYLPFEPVSSGKIGIQLNTGQFPEAEANTAFPAIKDAIDAYVSANSSNVVLLSNGHRKSPLASVAPTCETLEYGNLDTYLARLSGLRSVLTSHLHIAITAYSQRIPTFSLYVREKTKRFYDQIGRPERAIDITKASVDDLQKFLDAAECAEWSEKDEETLTRLQRQARSLLSFIE